MEGRSLDYQDGEDRLYQGAFYFPSFGQNKGPYAGREQPREKERPGRRQVPEARWRGTEGVGARSAGTVTRSAPEKVISG